MEVAYFTVAEVAEMTGSCTETVRNWIRSGKLKATRHPGSRSFVIARSDFEAFWPFPVKQKPGA